MDIDEYPPPCDELIAAAGDYAEHGGSGAVRGKHAERLAAAFARVTALASAWSTPAEIAAEAAECLSYADTQVEAAKELYVALKPSWKASKAEAAGQLALDTPDLGPEPTPMEWRPDHL